MGCPEGTLESRTVGKPGKFRYIPVLKKNQTNKNPQQLNPHYIKILTKSISVLDGGITDSKTRKYFV